MSTCGQELTCARYYLNPGAEERSDACLGHIYSDKSDGGKLYYRSAGKGDRPADCIPVLAAADRRNISTNLNFITNKAEKGSL